MAAAVVLREIEFIGTVVTCHSDEFGERIPAMKASLLTLLFLFCSVPLFAQRGNPSHGVHRDIAVIESELLRNYDEQAKLLVVAERLAKEILETHIERNRADAGKRKGIDATLDRLNHDSRMNSLELSRCALAANGLRLELERATRVAQNLVPGGHGRPGALPQVKSIRNLTFRRTGPVRVNGQLGYNDHNVYEIVFENGTSQRLEENTFTPIR